MPHATRPGDVLADRYRLVDLLSESGDGRFWRAHDQVLERHVAVHVIRADDARAPGLLAAARRSATVHDRRILRVLDADVTDQVCYVVNEWGWGTSLDIVVTATGPLGPRRAAWLTSEVADSIAAAHAADVPHGRLNPENVLIDRAGGVRLIGFCVDAALHGVSTEGLGHDVSDLAGLLYCALTGRWAGLSGSIIEAAPREHGELLRPRQVRAGVPRPLDVLCDELLHPGHQARGLTGFRPSARGIHEFLTEFVGDPTGMPAALVACTPPVLPDEELVVLPPVPDLRPHDAEPSAEASAEFDDDKVGGEPGGGSGAEPDPMVDSGPVDVPTEAGLPIFGEGGDDVSWLERRSTPVPPPPPFDEPPERPLFAPEPSGGAPRRTPRAGAAPPSGIRSGDEYWPFAGRADQSGRHPVVTAPTPEGPVPGRSWNRLASVVAVVVLLLVAVIVAINLGRGKTALGTDPDDDPSSVSPSPQPTAQVLRGVEAAALDPLGTDSGEENNQDAPLAVDGDPATAWDTEGYNDQFGPAGLKSGVGLSLDLGATRTVTGVDLILQGQPTDVSIFASQVPPQVDDIRLIAQGTARRDTLTLEPDEPVRARYLVVWLTRLPQESDGRFRGHIAEVAVRGE